MVRYKRTPAMERGCVEKISIITAKFIDR